LNMGGSKKIPRGKNWFVLFRFRNSDIFALPFYLVGTTNQKGYPRNYILHKKNLKKWAHVCVGFRMKWKPLKQEILMIREGFSMIYIFLKKIAKAKRTGRKIKHPSNLDEKKLDVEVL